MKPVILSKDDIAKLRWPKDAAFREERLFDAGNILAWVIKDSGLVRW